MAESTHIWLAEVESSEDIVEPQEEMDINQIEEIMDTRSNFHIPNINHQPNHVDKTTNNNESNKNIIHYNQQNTTENMNNDNNYLPEEQLNEEFLMKSLRMKKKRLYLTITILI